MVVFCDCEIIRERETEIEKSRVIGIGFVCCVVCVLGLEGRLIHIYFVDKNKREQAARECTHTTLCTLVGFARSSRSTRLVFFRNRMHGEAGPVS